MSPRIVNAALEKGVDYTMNAIRTCKCMRQELIIHREPNGKGLIHLNLEYDQPLNSEIVAAQQGKEQPK